MFIPVYIQTMFKHYCKVRVGAEDKGYIQPPYYVSFSQINSDLSMFNALRPFLFSYYNNKIICPTNMKKIFINCEMFYDQDYNKWKYENKEWCKYDDDDKKIDSMSLIKKEANIFLNILISLRC